ncbi:MAG TPA: ATP-binding protein [Thermoanaerobaculia bacterium]|jgi:signal transduction histidine kinase/ActR/RegA family two-component response regulator|nr:ATP-binding protein [Thermoanaerobaculia bacterium]
MTSPLDEAQSLRRCIRELAALSALSAAWSRTDPRDIAASLADVLLRSLPQVDFIYVRVLTPAVEVVRTHRGQEAAGSTREIGHTLEPLLRGGGPTPTLANPVGEGTARLAIIPMGYDGDCGFVVAGSQQQDFPTQTDRLLLSVGANQATVVLQHKRSEAALQETDRRKDEFLAILAHELRNPLAPLRNALRILELRGNDAQVLEQTRDIMERQLQQMVRLIDDLMDISRVTRGQVELRKERLDLAAVIRAALETSRPLIEESGHEITVAYPPKPVILHADPTRLAQVFANLLNNAAKYTPRGGRIWLTAERQDQSVLVKVRDTGVGIPDNMLLRIFETFTQVDRSLERPQGGLGIGLALVRSLVELHGGSVVARSDGPGQGSEFIVRLPVDPLPRKARAAEEDGKQVSTVKRRILVVDDNKDSADSLAMLLTLQGSEVRTAYDGLEAVAAAADFKPDVILSDIGMPGLDGYQAAQRIREQFHGKRAVLVAMTGWGQEDDKRRSMEAGFDFHLVKPVDLAVLEQLLDSFDALVGKAGE